MFAGAAGHRKAPLRMASIRSHTLGLSLGSSLSRKSPPVIAIAFATITPPGPASWWWHAPGGPCKGA